MWADLLARAASAVGLVRLKDVEGAISAMIRQTDQEWGVHPPDAALPDDPIKAYEHVVWYYSSVYHISTAIARIPLKLRRGVQGAEFDELPDHKAMQVMASPNEQGFSQFDLIEYTVGWLEINGNAYVVTDISEGFGGWLQLYPLPSNQVVIHPAERSPRGALLAGKFVFHGVEGQKETFTPDELIHIRYFSTNPFYGKSFIHHTINAAVGYSWAQRWNSAFMKNAARPDGLLTFQGKMEPALAAKIQTQWNQKHQGPDQAHKVQVAWQGAKYQQIGTNPKDMDFSNMLGTHIEEMLAGSGVPPFKQGIRDKANYANAREQDREFHLGTLQPKMLKVAAGYTRSVRAAYDDPDLFFEFDTTEVEAFQEEKGKLHERVRADFRDGLISRNEGRRETGREEDGFDYVVVPMGMVPQPVEDSGQAAGGERRGPATRRRLIPPRDVRVLPAAPDAKEIEVYRLANWKQFILQTDPIVTAFQDVFGDMIQDQTEEAIDRLGETMNLSALDFLLERESLMSAAAAAEPVIVDAAHSGADHAGSQVDALLARAVAGGALAIKVGLSDEDALILNENVIAFARANAPKLAGNVNATTQRLISFVVQVGVEDGATAQEIADAIRLRVASDEFLDARTLNIAVTESTAAYNFGTIENYDLNPGVEGKDWLSARDAHVRDPNAENPSTVSHRIDGQIRGVKEDFELPDTQVVVIRMGYPGDPKGPARARCYCRCGVLPKIAGGF